jgi:hypothetical protein
MAALPRIGAESRTILGNVATRELFRQAATMPQAMLRYLRAAGAVFFAALAIGLICLWVRSYESCEAAALNPGGQHALSITSYRGAAWLILFEADDSPGWIFVTIPADSITIYAPNGGILGIRLYRHGAETYLTLPHWCLAASSLSVGAMCVFKRSFRFSLRAILIATTLIAAMLGLAVYCER